MHLWLNHTECNNSQNNKNHNRDQLPDGAQLLNALVKITADWRFDAFPRNTLRNTEHQTHHATKQSERGNQTKQRNAGIIAIGSHGDAFVDAANRHTKEQRGQQRTNAEAPIPKRLPLAVVRAVLKRDSANNQAKQHQHHGKIEAGEGGCIGGRKRSKERTTCGKKPNLVTIPYRTDASTQHRFLFFVFAQNGIQHAHAQIESIEHEIHRNQNGNKEEPQSLQNGDIHDYSPSLVDADADTVAELSGDGAADADTDAVDAPATAAPGSLSTGPCLIKRATIRAHAISKIK